MNSDLVPSSPKRRASSLDNIDDGEPDGSSQMSVLHDPVTAIYKSKGGLNRTVSTGSIPCVPSTAEKYLGYDKYRMSLDDQLRVHRRTHRLRKKSIDCYGNSSDSSQNDVSDYDGIPRKHVHVQSRSSLLSNSNVNVRIQPIATASPLFPMLDELTEETNSNSSCSVSPKSVATPTQAHTIHMPLPRRASTPTEDDNTAVPRRKHSRRRKQQHMSLSYISIRKYIISELFDTDSSDMSSADPKAHENVENFLSVPYSMESLVWFGLTICVDAFLYLFTFLPLRVSVQLCSSCWVWLSNKYRGKCSPGNGFGGLNAYDTICVTVILIASYALQHFDMSYTYHFIRGQNMIKLYVLTSMIDVFERLLCSFGEDALSSMQHFSRTFSLQVSNRNNEGSGNAASVGEHYSLLFNVISSMTVYILYVVIHACFYFIKVATLTVAFNTTDQSFVTILILNNFAEMKSSVFKKFDPTQLFELTCSDIAERFQMALFLLCMVVVALAQSNRDALITEVLLPFFKASVYMSIAEVVCDWIKHAFIIKFNRYNASIYGNFARRLRSDLLISNSTSTSGQSSVVDSHDSNKHTNHHTKNPNSHSTNSNNAMRKIGLTHVSIANNMYWCITVDVILFSIDSFSVCFHTLHDGSLLYASGKRCLCNMCRCCTATHSSFSRGK